MSRPLHLTSGPITSQLLSLCLPLLCANVLQQLYNIANSLIVTRYIGDQAFAALGVAESVMNLYIYAVSYTHLDVYKRQVWGGAPTGRPSMTRE